MGALWTSPYRLQVLVICLGLLFFTGAFIFLLLSIGLGDFHWRLVGGVCASTGSALLVIGICWCVWVVRRSRFGPSCASNLGGPDSEAQTLTSDAAYREESGIDGPCIAEDTDELGPDEDYDTDDLDDDDDDDDDEDDEDEDDEDGDDEDGEEEYGAGDDRVLDVCIDKRYKPEDLVRSRNADKDGRDYEHSVLETKEEASRLIPV